MKMGYILLVSTIQIEFATMVQRHSYCLVSSVAVPVRLRAGETFLFLPGTEIGRIMKQNPNRHFLLQDISGIIPKPHHLL